MLNDDRVGGALEALFDPNRASLLTSGSVHGAYANAIGTVRGGKPTPVITFGRSKDHQPDLKQLVWILTVSSDGAVPLAYRLADGNTSDDPTHVPTGDGLVARPFALVCLVSGDHVLVELPTHHKSG